MRLRPSEARSYPEPTAGETDSFMVRATDEQGHSARLQFRVPPPYVRLIEVVVQSKKFPYQTLSDVLRHALHRHLEFLACQDPDLDLQIGHLTVINMMVAKQRELLQFDQSLKNLKATVSELEDNGAFAEARQLVAQILKQLSAMESTALTRRYEQQLRQRFPHLVDGEEGSDRSR